MGNLTSKNMFEISEQLILEQSDEIFGVSQISWEISSWKQLSLFNDEEVISLSHAKVCVFSDSSLFLGKMIQNPTPNTVRERQLEWFKESITIQNIGDNRRRACGIRVECFPRSLNIGKVHEQHGRMSVLCTVMLQVGTRTVVFVSVPPPLLNLSIFSHVTSDPHFCCFGAKSVKPFVMCVGNGLTCAAVLTWLYSGHRGPSSFPTLPRRQKRWK